MTDEFDSIPQPFLKWAGGKRSLLRELMPKVPVEIGKYIEPFLGAGAMFFAIGSDIPKVGNDFNSELILAYLTIRDKPDELMSELDTMENSLEAYLKIRSLDREPNFTGLSDVHRAARFIYLNKTCYNGLYRVNSKGQFNVPYGNFKNPDIRMKDKIRTVSRYLNASAHNLEVPQLMSGEFLEATRIAEAGDFVYCDPPYDPISPSASFVSYQRDGFGRVDQTNLRDEAIRLTELGVRIMISNSETEFVKKLYSDKKLFEISRAVTRRTIGANGSSRGKISELVITNNAYLNWHH